MSNITDVHIEDFLPHNAAQVSQLYHDAIQQINHPRYPQAKLNAWSTAPRSNKHWQIRYRKHQAWVAVDQQQIVVGFIGVETHFKTQGYIDCLYVTPKWQGRGIAQQLLTHLHQWATEQGFSTLSVDASYLSKPLFEKAGFSYIQPSFQIKKHQTLNGFYLQKNL